MIPRNSIKSKCTTEPLRCSLLWLVVPSFVNVAALAFVYLATPALIEFAPNPIGVIGSGQQERYLRETRVF